MKANTNVDHLRHVPGNEDVSKSYEAPLLLEIGQATSLLQGHVYTENYRDCNTTGTTRYATGC